jgi:hypothetical protein
VRLLVAFDGGAYENGMKEDDDSTDDTQDEE